MAVYEILNEERTMKLKGIMSPQAIDSKWKAVSLAKVSIISGKVSAYFTLKKNVGYKKYTFNPGKPTSKLDSRSVYFKKEVVAGFQKLNFLAGSEQELVIAEFK
jgi:hypothetical protein